MISYPINTDIVNLLELQTEALQSLADANEVTLIFKSSFSNFNLKIQPEILITDFVQLLSKVIIFTPQDHWVNVALKKCGNDKYVQIQIYAEGSLLAIPEQELYNLKSKITIDGRPNQGTLYTLFLSSEQNIINTKKPAPLHLPKQEIVIPDFYKKFRSQLKTHITTYQNLEQKAAEISQKDGILLKKVNAIIIGNLNNVKFDTTTLAQALALSRTQLYRKLKPLIRQSPGKYIRFVRLQKAKEMLKDSDLSIGEIGDQVGFYDQSHFTRAFKNQYGYNPSHLKSNLKSSLKSSSLFKQADS
jgi:AraC-like DNA-binding protein